MSTATVAIRAAGRDDLPAIMGIYNWAVNQTFATLDAEPLSEEEATHWWETNGRTGVLVVAETEDGVAGWGRLQPWTHRGFSATVEDLVYVDPLQHGQGVGQALLRELINQATTLRYRTIIASVAADNSAGLHLHERLGFERVGTIRNAAHKFNRWMDIVLVQRALEP